MGGCTGGSAVRVRARGGGAGAGAGRRAGLPVLAGVMGE
jgi:hypothetical protein